MSDSEGGGSALAAVQSQGSQPDTQAVVVVQIVQNGTTLECVQADRESLDQHSRFFKARLSSNWCSSQQQQQVSVQLHVRQPEHVSMAAALVRYMDCGQLPAHLDAEAAQTSPRSALAAQADLVILGYLSDKYQVPQLMCHVLRELQVLLRHHPSWQAVLFLLRGVQDSLSSCPAFSTAHRLARAAALKGLQDLEGVMCDVQRVQVLTCLPFEVLLQLVGSCDTQVAAESTVVEALSTWLCGQPAGAVSRDQLAQLCAKVRFRGLPRCFLLTVLPQLDWYTEGAGAGTVNQALTFLQSLDMLRLEQAQQTTTPSSNGKTTSHHNSGSSSSSAGHGSSTVSPQELAESRALGVVLEKHLRSSEFWVNALLAPRAKSSIQQLVLAADLSRARLGAAYNSKSCNNNSSSSSSWQLPRGGAGVFGGLQWQLSFRFVATRCSSSSSKASCCYRKVQQQQQQQLAVGSKRKQRAFMEQEQAAAAAMEAAAVEAAGAGGIALGPAAMLEQVLLDSMLQGDDQPTAISPAAGTAAVAAITTDGNTAGVSMGSAAALEGPQTCRHVIWQLQFGVSFAVPYLPTAQGPGIRPSIMLPPPSLQHRQACAPSSSMYTRGQKARMGFDASKAPRLLEEGKVLPCVQVLPLMLSSPSWDEECDRKLAQFLDTDGRLRASTTISGLK